jgi:hypothetical protein
LYTTNFNPHCPLCRHRPLSTEPPVNLNGISRPILAPDSDDDDDESNYQQVRNDLIAHLLLATHGQSIPESDDDGEDFQITDQHAGTWLASANRQRPNEHVRDLLCLQQDDASNLCMIRPSSSSHSPINAY